MFLPDFGAPAVLLAHASPIVLVEIADLVLDEITAKFLCHHVNLCGLTLIPIVNLDVVVAQVRNPRHLCLHLEFCASVNTKHL